MLCNGQLMDTAMRHVSQDVHLVTPFVDKEVPALAPGAALEISLNPQDIAGAKKDFTCKFDVKKLDVAQQVQLLTPVTG